MTTTLPTRAYAPATLANVAVGFDVMGLAARPLDGSLWGDVVEVHDAGESAPALRLQIAGPHAKDLPRDPKRNLVHAIAERFLEPIRRAGRAVPALRIVLEKNLPVSSGLGGSASSAVAALVALNHHLGTPRGKDDLLRHAGASEGLTSGSEHYDNVTPALFGGVRLLRGGGPEGSLRLPWPEGWVIAFVAPEVQVSTRRSRAALPRKVALADAVRYWRNLAVFVIALQRADADLARSCLDDGVIEPARSHLVPGFPEAKRAALEAGALGCSFSGSGPTTFAIAATEAIAERVAAAMVDRYENAGLRAVARLAGVDDRGARILE